jgi:hypothetical protein
MRLFPTLPCLLLTLSLQAETIPPVHSTTFANQPITLPESLNGHTAILILGFSESSRTAASAWGHRLADDPQRPSNLLFYEMPVLESVPRLLRGWVLKKIKDSVSPAGQPHFLPVLDHEKEWKQAAAFTNPDAAYILVVDQTGTIRYRSAQPLTDQTYTEALTQTR